MEKYYVDQYHQIHFGENASKFLEQNNDTPFYTKDGVLSVPYERWLQAQIFEESYWMSKGLAANDDRNYEHLERFLAYKALKGTYAKSVFEIGCGPFTNTRLIVPYLHGVEKIHLLDPLISSYLKHPNCTYSSNTLCGIPVTLHNMPVEEFLLDEKFDVVIFINVLEHCFNVESIFQKIKNLLNPGGTLIFSEAGIESKDVDFISKNQMDVGHPLRVTVEYMNKFLGEFQQEFRSDFKGLYNNKWRSDIYFIGKF